MIRAVIVLVAVAVGLVGCESKQDKSPLKPAPKVTAVVPPVVTPMGYRLGQINGEGFDPKAPVKVFFGNSPAKRAAIVAKNLITVEIPPGTNNTEVDVRVEVQGYEPATAPMKVRYDEQDHGESAREALEHAKEGAHDEGAHVEPTEQK
jgi:hypothetical protein